jgi:glycosyltransferase involved in cell wall biosynthesis
MKSLRRPRHGSSRVRRRVGWVAATTLHGGAASFRALDDAVAMRVANNARWLDSNSEFACEMYRPDERYDIVIFFKAMDARCQTEAERIKDRGGVVIFDANVNYYEIWGEYEIPGTRPTDEQKRDAAAFTRSADHVVADSTYLADIARAFNSCVSWVPDNVDIRRYKPGRARKRDETVRLVWSGIAKKAMPLLSVADALSRLRSAELVLVSNEPPEVMPALQAAIPCRFVRWSERHYPGILRSCDVIISPKRLVNGYELGHTEYKITLGMAVGLPAVASPQQSYVEAISCHGGGFIANSIDEWQRALDTITADRELRATLGRRARLTVEQRYATPVVAHRYLEVLRSL